MPRSGSRTDRALAQGSPIVTGPGSRTSRRSTSAYYYPSKGSHVCAHTARFGASIDLCCPDAGSALCSLLDTSGKP